MVHETIHIVADDMIDEHGEMLACSIDTPLCVQRIFTFTELGL